MVRRPACSLDADSGPHRLFRDPRASCPIPDGRLPFSVVMLEPVRANASPWCRQLSTTLYGYGTAARHPLRVTFRVSSQNQSREHAAEARKPAITGLLAKSLNANELEAN